MIFYVLIAAFVGGGLLGAGGMNWWNEAAIARAERAQAEAQAKVDQAAQEARQTAENTISDMESAYKAGEANAKIVTKTIYVKGQSYVASTPVFSNPQCVVPDDGVSILNVARTGHALVATSVPPEVQPQQPQPQQPKSREQSNGRSRPKPVPIQ